MYGSVDAVVFGDIATDPASASDDELSASLTSLEEAERVVFAAKARVLAEWDRRQVWAADGCRSGATWMAANTEVTTQQAHRDLQRARRLAAMPGTTAALEAGKISATKACALADRRTDAVADAFDQVEDVLLEAIEGLRMDHAIEVLRAFTRTAQADGSMPAPERVGVSLSPMLDGYWRIDGTLDADSAAIVKGALDRIGEELWRQRRHCPHDGQPVAGARQRRAEALTEACRRSLAAEPGARVPKPAVITITEAPNLDAPDRTPAPLGSICEIDGIGPITGDTARRLACDSEHTPITVGPGPVADLLDLGRTSRFPTPALRQAIVVRDRTCQWPGCRAPGHWCDTHHVRHWTRDHGPTSSENLVLLCRYHHRLLHEGGYHLTRAPDGTLHFTRPDDTAITTKHPDHLPWHWGPAA